MHSVMTCPECGKEVKNLGAHMRFCKGSQEIVIDEFTEKPLSGVISEIRAILKPYLHKLEINVAETGTDTDVTVTARFIVRKK